MIRLGPVDFRSDAAKSNAFDNFDQWTDQGRRRLLGFDVLYSDCAVFALRFHYLHNGEEVTSGNTSVFIGTQFKQVRLKYRSEYLVSVSGTYVTTRKGWGLKSITFNTNKDEYGPYGDDYFYSSTREFSFEWGPDDNFYGMYGKYGYNLKLLALGVYIASPSLDSDKRLEEKVLANYVPAVATTLPESVADKRLAEKVPTNSSPAVATTLPESVADHGIKSDSGFIEFLRFMVAKIYAYVLG